jgi:hypothetical protein
MKISERFYQFKNEKALIIVSGTERAEIFACSNGEMDKISSIAAEKIEYSDKEGTYIGKRGLFRGGSLLDDVDEKEKSVFLKLLGEEYARLKSGGYDYIALMAPKESVGRVIDSLGIAKGEIIRKVRVIKEGNFLHYSSEELLELITPALVPLAG